MALQSQLFGGDPKLEAAAVSDPAHIFPGARGPHVGKIQLALIRIDGVAITQDSVYGPATAAAVRAFKQKRQILNFQGKIDDIVGKKTMSALDEGMLGKEKDGGGEPTQPFDLVRLINEFAVLLQPVQRESFLGPANLLVSRSAIVGGGTNAAVGAIPIVIIVLFIIILFMIALTAQSQNPATKQMGREWERRLARLREQIRGKPIEVQTAKTLEETRQMGRDVVENAETQRQKCLDRLSPEKLRECEGDLAKLEAAIESLKRAVKAVLVKGRRGSDELSIMSAIGRAAQAVFAASRAAAQCTGCDNMVL
jgi:lysozyme family protein